MTNLFTKIKNLSTNVKSKFNDAINHFGRRRVAVVGASVCVLLLAGGVTTAVALSGGFDGVNPDNAISSNSTKEEKHHGDANLNDGNNETSDNTENADNNTDGNNANSNNDGSVADNNNSDNSRNTSNTSNSNGGAPVNNGGNNATVPSGTGNSGGSTAHVHTWTTVHHDAVTHQEPIYKWVSYIHCNLCGFETLSDEVATAHAKSHIHAGDTGWSCSNRVVQERDGYNTVIDSLAYDEKYCTSCGARC